MDEIYKRFRALLTSIVSLAVVDRPDGRRYQVLYGPERAASGIEHYEPQGVHFAVPGDSKGVLLSPGGVREAAVMVGASGAAPADSVASGEGGLHYLGEWRVFMDSDGKLHLGARDASEWAAIASYVDARISAIVSGFNSHTHPTPSGTSSVPSTPLASQASVASATVKVSP